MGRTKGNIIETFIDKIVLAAAVIAALIVLLLFVIGSPASADWRGRKVSSGKINEAIRSDTQELGRKLQEKIQEKDSDYTSQTSIYLSFIENSVKNVNTNIYFPLPGSPEGTSIGDRTYHLPEISRIAEPSIGIVTMTAFIPAEELTDETGYDKAQTKLEDVDIVTVASSINSKQLYERFYAAFAGKNIPAEQKEKQYGRPVFAKVELQRRILLKDGSWGQWTEVPKTKINRIKKALLPTQPDDYSTQIALEQFAKAGIRDEVLQPPVYDNAIPAEKWICPPFYDEREKRLEKEKEDIKKQRLEAEKARRLQERAAGRRTPTRRAPSTRSKTSSGPTGMGGPGGPGSSPQINRSSPTIPRTTPTTSPRTVSPRPRTRPASAADTEEQQFSEICLSEKTDPADLENLVFWAHDDTAVPGEKYQYRIRIGVINPIAGKPWFSEDQKDLKDQMVLFSSFSESNPDNPVEIPRHLYFFATDSKEKDTGKAIDKTVDIKVARWTMGNWITKTFNVHPGDYIGDIISTAGTKLEEAGSQAEFIDLSTGNIMVDTRLAAGLTSTGRMRDFYEILYCKPGEAIEQMPIKERYWPEEIAKVYKEISDAEDAEAVVLLTRNEAQSGTGTKSRSGSPDNAETSPGPGSGPTAPSSEGGFRI